MAKDFFDQFDDAPKPEAKSGGDFFEQFQDAAPKAEEVSKLKSATLGAADSASLGFADEAYGGIKNPMGALKTLVSTITGNPNPTDEDVLAYARDRDAARSDMKAAYDANPKSYIGGGVAGGLATALVPGLGAAKLATTGAKIAAGAAAGLGTGALGGVGASEADNLTDLAQDAAIGGTIGGAMGGAGAGLGVLAGKGAKLVKDALIKPTGLIDDFARGVEGGQALQAAAKEGVEAAPEDLIKINARATPEVQQQVLENAGDAVSRDIKLGLTEVSAALDELVQKGQQVDLTPYQNRLSQLVDEARKSGSMDAMKSASEALKKFKQASGITMATKEQAGETLAKLPAVMDEFQTGQSAKLNEFGQKASSAIEGGKKQLAEIGAEGGLKEQAARAAADASLDETSRVTKLINTNQFDDALNQMEGLWGKIPEAEFDTLNKTLYNRMRQVEENSAKEGTRQNLLGVKKRLVNLFNKDEKLASVMDDESIPLEFREQLGAQIKNASSPTEMNRLLSQKVEDLSKAKLMSSTPDKVAKTELLRSVDDKLSQEIGTISQETNQKLAKQQESLAMLQNTLDQERQGLIQSGSKAKTQISSTLKDIKQMAETNPEQALASLRSVKDVLGEESYNRLEANLRAITEVPSGRKAINAVESAEALKGLGGEAGKVAQDMEALVPDLTQAFKDNKDFSNMVSDLGIDPKKVEFMSSKEFADNFQRFIKSRLMNATDEERQTVQNTLKAGMSSQNEVTKNVATSINSQIEKLAPVFERLNIKKKLDILPDAIKMVGGKVGEDIAMAATQKVGNWTNAAGRVVGETFEPSTVTMMNKIIGGDGSTMKSIGERLLESPIEARRTLGEAMMTMSDATPDKRRVLMFSIQNNPEYRQLLKEMNDKEKN